MSRSGYTDDCDDNLAAGRYAGALKRAINGRRGQAFLKEAISALDRIPERSLAANTLREANGMVCTLGAVANARSLDVDSLTDRDIDDVAIVFGIAPSLAREITYQNDEANAIVYSERHGPPVSIFRTQELGWDKRLERPDERWGRMRLWIQSNINEQPSL